MAKVIWRAGKIAVKIILPIMVLGLILYFVKVFTFAQVDGGVGSEQTGDESAVIQTDEELPVDPASVALEEAFAYRLDEDFKQAKQSYAEIIQQYPDSDYAFKAQQGLTISYIAWAKPTEAQTALGDLMACDADDGQMASALRDVADHYRWFEYHETALELYQYVIDNHPQEDGAMWSQAGMAILYISQYDYDAAAVAVDKLFRDYYGHEKIADAACEIAEWYREQQKHQEAHSLYQYIVDNQPDDEVAFWANVGLGICNTRLGNEDAAGIDFDTLVRDYAEDERIGKAIYLVADDYRRSKQYEDARQIYQYIVDNWPEDERAIWAQMGVTVMNARLGDPNAVEASFNKLLTNYADDPRLPTRVWDVGREYYAMGLEKEKAGLDREAASHFQDAMAVGEMMIEKFPQCSGTTDACFWLANSYRKWGRHEEMIESYERLLAVQPDYKYAWHIQFLVGYNYEKLGDRGIISKSEAMARTRAAYELVVQEYPDCPAAKAARNWLEHHPASDKGEQG